MCTLVGAICRAGLGRCPALCGLSSGVSLVDLPSGYGRRFAGRCVCWATLVCGARLFPVMGLCSTIALLLSFRLSTAAVGLVLGV